MDVVGRASPAAALVTRASNTRIGRDSCSRAAWGDTAQLRRLAAAGWDLSAADLSGLRLASAGEVLFAVRAGANLAWRT